MDAADKKAREIVPCMSNWHATRGTCPNCEEVRPAVAAALRKLKNEFDGQYAAWLAASGERDKLREHIDGLEMRIRIVLTELRGCREGSDLRYERIAALEDERRRITLSCATAMAENERFRKHIVGCGDCADCLAECDPELSDALAGRDKL